MNNIRFWHYWNGGYVKLTLTPSKPVINLSHGYETDEGWHRDDHTFRLSHWDDGFKVEFERISDGSDCDGRLTYTSEYIMDGFYKEELDITHNGLHKAKGIEVTQVISVPNWNERSHETYDQFARMAGY